MLLPHPTLQLSEVLPQKSTELTEYAAETYLGVSGDSLFAMSAEKFPLAALAPQAPASYDWDKAGLSSGEGDRDIPLGGSGKDATCYGFGCWTGSYTVQRDAEAEWAMKDLLIGSPLSLGWGEDSIYPGRPRQLPTLDAPKGSSQGVGRSEGNENVAGDKKSGSKPSTGNQHTAARYTRRTFFAQAGILLVLGVLSWSILTGLEVLRQKQAEEAEALAKGLVLAPPDQHQADVPVLVETKEDAPPAQSSPPNGSSAPQVQDPSEVSLANSDLKGSNGSTSEGAQPAGMSKSAAAKRKRRGKRAGQLVAAKAAKGKGDTILHELGEDEPADSAVADAINDSPATSRESISTDKVVRPKSPRETMAKMDASASSNQQVQTATTKQAQSSLVIFDEILGESCPRPMHFMILIVCGRLWVVGNCRLQRFIPGKSSGGEEAIERLCSDCF